MNVMRLTVGILLVVASVLLVVENAVWLAAGLTDLAVIGVLAGNVLTLVAGAILILSVKKQGKVDWRFEFTAALLLFFSSLLLVLPAGYMVALFSSVFEYLLPGVIFFGLIADLAGTLVFLVCTVLMVTFSKRYGSLNLARFEGLAFVLVFLAGAMLGTISYGALLTGAAAAGVGVFILVWASLFSSALIQLVAMLILLYPYLR